MKKWMLVLLVAMFVLPVGQEALAVFPEEEKSSRGKEGNDSRPDGVRQATEEAGESDGNE